MAFNILCNPGLLVKEKSRSVSKSSEKKNSKAVLYSISGSTDGNNFREINPKTETNCYPKSKVKTNHLGYSKAMSSTSTHDSLGDKNIGVNDQRVDRLELINDDKVAEQSSHSVENIEDWLNKDINRPVSFKMVGIRSFGSSRTIAPLKSILIKKSTMDWRSADLKNTDNIKKVKSEKHVHFTKNVLVLEYPKGT